MQAMKHVYDGDLDAARKVLRNIPGAEEETLQRIEAGAATLSDLAREERGNREQRRAAARRRHPAVR